jgi:hypothetical protein
LAASTGLIYLPLIVAGTLQPVSPVQDTTITFPAAVLAKNPALAGVQITVPANSLFSDNGTRGGMVGIAPVASDRLPEPLPPGLTHVLDISIQTDGPNSFDRPVPVRFPNLPDPTTGQKLPPGAKSALWSYDHDKGQWIIAGPMTVTADGNFVESDPGYGVKKPGWHGSQPGTQTDAPPPPFWKPCGADSAAGDNFSFERCRNGVYVSAAGLIVSAAKAASNPDGVTPAEAIKLLKEIKDTNDEATNRRNFCQACCIAFYGDAVCGSFAPQFAEGALSSSPGQARLRIVSVPTPADTLQSAETLLSQLSQNLSEHLQYLASLGQILGGASNPSQLPPAQLAQYNATLAQMNAFLGGRTPAEFYTPLLKALGSGTFDSLASNIVLDPGKAYYRLVDLEAGFERRGRTDAYGRIAGLILAPQHLYSLERFFPDTFRLRIGYVRQRSQWHTHSSPHGLCRA